MMDIWYWTLPRGQEKSIQHIFDDQKYRRQREDKEANRIVKGVRKRKNRMWEIKCRWHNWGLTIGRNMTFFREFTEWFPIFWVTSNHHEGIGITNFFLLRIGWSSLRLVFVERDVNRMRISELLSKD